MIPNAVVESLEASVEYIRSICPPTKLKPRVAIVLGSGLGSFVNNVEIEAAIPYSDIPGFIPPTVEGHKGRLILGHVRGVPVDVKAARFLLDRKENDKKNATKTAAYYLLSTVKRWNWALKPACLMTKRYCHSSLLI